MRKGYWGYEIVRIVVACVLLFSGLAKAIDPVGTMTKVSDYMSIVFGISWSWVTSQASALAVGLIALEFLLGAFLLSGIYRRLCARMTFVLLLGMTILTGYIYLADVRIDCGCFGDALKLTAGETFLKNLILLPLSLALVVRARKLRHLFSRRERWIPALLAILGISYCLWESYSDLPYYDFLPYKVGYNLREKIEEEESRVQADLNASLRYVYQREGREQEFTLDNLPDSSWTYVEQRNLSLESSSTKLYNFHPTDQEGNDYAEHLLDADVAILLCSPRWDKASQETIDSYKELHRIAEERGYKFYSLSPSTAKEQEVWDYQTGALYPHLILDASTIKTMTRANPGLILLKKGVVLDKIPASRMPLSEELMSFLKSRLEWGESTQPLAYRWIVLALWCFSLLVALTRRLVRRGNVSRYLYGKRISSIVNNKETKQ